MAYSSRDLILNVYPNTIIAIANDMLKQVIDNLNYIHSSEYEGFSDEDYLQFADKLDAFHFSMDSLERSFKFIYENQNEEMLEFHNYCKSYLLISLDDVKRFAKEWK